MTGDNARTPAMALLFLQALRTTCQGRAPVIPDRERFDAADLHPILRACLEELDTIGQWSREEDVRACDKWITKLLDSVENGDDNV
jgi:hypothetical protein